MARPSNKDGRAERDVALRLYACAEVAQALGKDPYIPAYRRTFFARTAAALVALADRAMPLPTLEPLEDN